MLNKKNMAKIWTVFLMLALLAAPQLSYADWGHHNDGRFYRYHDHPHFGLRVSFLPHGYFSLWVGGTRYYYDGLYYNYVGGGYVLISPPVGAVVTAIPSDFQPVVINGVTYYVNNGTYYLYTPHGYRVIAQPVMIVQPPPVVIKRSGNGYVGPQGEFYATFPTVAQLKVMYGK